MSIFLMSLSILACEPETIPSLTSSINASELSKSIANTGFDLFTIMAERDSNVLISPLSIHNAISMISNGSVGPTKNEFMRILHVEDYELSRVNEAYEQLYSGLETKKPLKSLMISNGLFYDHRRYKPNAEFLNTLERHYDLQKSQLNFESMSSINEINEWVNENTKSKINKVLEAIEIDEILLIINTLYFQSGWQNGFEKALTTNMKFMNQGGREVRVPTMMSDATRAHVTGEQFDALDIEFDSGSFAASFIMPKRLDINQFIREIQEENFSYWFDENVLNRLKEGRVKSYIPKFELKAQYNLKEFLQTLGMTETFSSPDFGNLGTSPSGRVNLSRILHDAFIEIDEGGVEGGAATTMGISICSAPPVIAMDQAFIFILRHIKTRMPIFIAKVSQL